tara:strand:- start:508 stop:711 length:204 start_codon:yes stop_codon:yes gene_type:complete
MVRIKEYSLGDMVDLKFQLRKPRLRGIIIQRLGYDRHLDDFVYLVYCFTLKPAKKMHWLHWSIEKVS